MADDDLTPAPPVWTEFLPWQHSVAAEALARRATWPHALLVVGARGIGKHVLAMNFARCLLCEAPRGDGFACGTCASCRYLAAGQHPDLRRVEPLELEDDGAVLRIEPAN